MKKIFRMALVFALAGATLMYTGCTKDYGEEIDKLDSKLSNVESTLSSKLTDLEGQLSTLKSGVNALDAAYKAADDAIKGDVTKLQGRIAAVEDAIKDLDKLATKEELKDVKEALEKKIADDLKAVKDELLAKAQNLQDQIDAINAALKLKADADKVYTKEEVDAFLAKYYTQEEIDAFLATKADKDAVFTKDEIVAFLAEKADKSAVYTKEEVDAFFAKYLTADQVKELLEKKADKDAVYTKDEIAEILKAYYTSEEIDKIFKDYYTANQVDELLKNYFTKDEINDLLKAYYTAEQIDKMFEEKLANYYTKAEIEDLLKKYYTAEQIDKMLEEEFAKYYNKEEVDAFLALKADKEEVEAMVKAVQDNLNEVFELLSDELRSIVFQPDLYFAGVEATTYDIGSFLGFRVIETEGDWTWEVENTGTGSNITYATFPEGAKVEADLYYLVDDKGNMLFYKYDPDKMEYVRDAKGELVQCKESDKNAAPYFPHNDWRGQVGKAKYNLNPSSFVAENDPDKWWFESRDVRYLVKGDNETPWTPVFLGIEKDADGLATVDYEIEHPEWLFSSVIGGVVEGVISWLGSAYRLVDFYQQYDFLPFDVFDSFGIQRPRSTSGSAYNYFEGMSKWTAAFEYEFNNIPTMHLVGKLDDDRTISSDWHAVSSTAEVISHLAFRNDNPYVAFDECGLGEGATSGLFSEISTLLGYFIDDDQEFTQGKDLFYDAWTTLYFDASVPVKYNGGPVDLEKLIAIHTMDYDTQLPYKSYTLEELNAKYPGYELKFELVPYTLGDVLTGEEYYGQINGTEFTPCYVKWTQSKPQSIPIAKNDESIEGISAVGRMPMVIVTLENVETGYIHTVGWFRIRIVKDIKDPTTIFLPDMPLVPYICGDFRIASTWDMFSDFVLENLGMEYKTFRNSYDYCGVYAKIGGKYVPIDHDKDLANGYPDNSTFHAHGELKVPVSATKTEIWGSAHYYVDEQNPTAINDAFIWDVKSHEGMGENKTQTIYYKFINGEHIVYFAMTATTAERAHLNFVENKINKEWYDDIDGEVKNTVRLNVPVPVANEDIPEEYGDDLGPGGDVMKFQRDINHWFVGYEPILGIKETTDPIYAYFFNATAKGDPDAKGVLDFFAGNDDMLYDDDELISKTEFFFDKNQPKIVDDKTLKEYQLGTNYWGDATVNGKLYSKSKLLFVVDPKQNENGHPKAVDGSEIAWIMPREVVYDAELDRNFVTDTLKYLDTDIAKVLLNLWSYTEEDQNKMLYANILAVNTYGPCNIPTDDGLFHVRFVRPLDVDFKDVDVAEESAVDGWNVEIAKFISGITDWNHQSVIVKEMKKNAQGKMEWTGYYVPNVIKTVNMYNYYLFTRLRFNLKVAEINNWNVNDPDEFGLLSEKLPKAKLQLGSVDLDESSDTYGVFTPYGTSLPSYVTEVNDPETGEFLWYEVDLSDFDNVRGIFINYRNDEAISEEFQLRIPVWVDYSWGTLNAYMVVNVQDTGSTSPN